MDSFTHVVHRCPSFQISFYSQELVIKTKLFTYSSANVPIYLTFICTWANSAGPAQGWLGDLCLNTEEPMSEVIRKGNSFVWDSTYKTIDWVEFKIIVYNLLHFCYFIVTSSVEWLIARQNSDGLRKVKDRMIWNSWQKSHLTHSRPNKHVRLADIILKRIFYGKLHWYLDLIVFGSFCFWQSSLLFMMTSSNGNIFRVTGPLCGEFTGHRTKASDSELWHFLWSVPE